MNTPQPPDSIAQQTIGHYNNYDEAQRLKDDIGPLEFARTQELIARYLPPPGAEAFDEFLKSGQLSELLAKRAARGKNATLPGGRPA
jgi:hypothetical protein